VENEPWALADKQDEQSRARLATILYTCAEAVRIVTALVHPVIPEATARIWTQLGLGDVSKSRIKPLAWGQLELGTRLGKIEPVFPRADKTVIEKMQSREQQARAAASTAAGEGSGAAAAPPAAHAAQAAQLPAAATPVNASAASAAAEKITIDDFVKVDLRVGQIKAAEKVKGADKLLRLEVDIGSEVRQIVAGIATAYAPESLIGRKIVIVANLQPRKLRGLESNGMIVAASLGDGSPVLAGFLEDVPVGARLK
jgi:methionyl-tRNA synthetase